MLATDRAGRARAFFKGSSATAVAAVALLDFGLLLASGWREVERSRFWTGPASSADERGREACVCMTLMGCERVGRCIWIELSGRNDVSLGAL